MKEWESLPEIMQTDEVRKYYDILRKKNIQLFFKRIFDVVMSLILMILFSPLFLVLAIIIKTDSKGSVFFRQKRVTQYGRIFKIFKFRTMVQDADKIGALVTSTGDSRVTSVGRVMRKYRLDELPQVINVFLGDMTFVGSRPEVIKYVNRYTSEMWATLLLPTGVTSKASILYKDEEKYITQTENADETYVNVVLPEKMKYNYESLINFGLWDDIKTMFATVRAVFGDR
ncbi:MAG: glycosyl transferase [Clostridiales bacterium]|nr:MAG: glycosyl transferase [Clostridiales bacterium]